MPDFAKCSTDSQWSSNIMRDHDGNIDTQRELDRHHKAIEAMQIAAVVHPCGPTILIMRAAGDSYRTIGKRVSMSDVHVQRLHAKILQAVARQTL